MDDDFSILSAIIFQNDGDLEVCSSRFADCAGLFYFHEHVGLLPYPHKEVLVTLLSAPHRSAAPMGNQADAGGVSPDSRGGTSGWDS